MSENLDLVRSIYEAAERGDFSSIDRAHPDLEYVVADGPAPGRWRGASAFAQDMRDWLSAWDDYRVWLDEAREIDQERILTFHSSSGRGRTSGLDLTTTRERGANVFHVRCGKVTRLVSYCDCEHALADLGLEE